MKDIQCIHKNSYFFHDNAPRYCPDCDCYVDGDWLLVKNNSNIKPYKP